MATIRHTYITQLTSYVEGYSCRSLTLGHEVSTGASQRIAVNSSLETVTYSSKVEVLLSVDTSNMIIVSSSYNTKDVEAEVFGLRT